MYLFNRRTRLVGGNGSAGIEWATSIAAKVKEVTGQDIQLWATVYSPGFGTIAWTGWFDDLSALEKVGDTLQGDASMTKLSDQGPKFTEGGLDDGIWQPVYGAPDPTRAIQYVSTVTAVAAPGAIERAIGVGVEIAQKVEAVTGSSCLFSQGAHRPVRECRLAHRLRRHRRVPGGRRGDQRRREPHQARRLERRVLRRGCLDHAADAAPSPRLTDGLRSMGQQGWTVAKRCGRANLWPMDFTAYLADLPALHTWDRGDDVEHRRLRRRQLGRVHALIAERFGDRPVSILETGAGNSTITFLHRPLEAISSPSRPPPTSVTGSSTIAPSHQIDTAPLDFRVERSEIELPAIAFRCRGRNQTDSCTAFRRRAHRRWPRLADRVRRLLLRQHDDAFGKRCSSWTTPRSMPSASSRDCSSSNRGSPSRKSSASCRCGRRRLITALPTRASRRAVHRRDEQEPAMTSPPGADAGVDGNSRISAHRRPD